jgi:hypothetical protein
MLSKYERFDSSGRFRKSTELKSGVKHVKPHNLRREKPEPEFLGRKPKAAPEGAAKSKERLSDFFTQRCDCGDA